VRSYFDNRLIAAGFMATVAMVSIGWLACAGPPAQVDKTTDDEVLTAKQCIDEHTTKGYVEPLEDALVAEGIVDADLDKLSFTHGMCEEIIERTPGGSPVERAAAIGNLTQELEIIRKSMEDAADKDVNGDGRVDAEDTKIADAASYAASRAAQETARRATEEGNIDGGAIKEINAVPAAYLQDADQYQYGGDGGGGNEGGGNGGGGNGGGGYASASASASAKAGAGETRYSAGGIPSHEKVQTNASSAAQEKGADSKAAAGGGQCAATVALVDVTLRLIMGHMIFKAPAKKLNWKEYDRAQLVVAPKAVNTIEQLKQEVDQAEGAGEVEAGCLHLGRQIEPKITSDGGLDIRWIDEPKKEVRRDTNITWRWDIGANERGFQPLYLNVTGYVYTSEGRSPRQVEDSLYEDYINVSATRGEVLTDFVARRWPVLVEKTQSAKRT
jgi:hypothetical protein